MDEEPLYPPAEWFTSDGGPPSVGTVEAAVATPSDPPQPMPVEPQRVVVEHWVYHVPPAPDPAPAAFAVVRRPRGQRLWEWIDPRRWLWLGLLGFVVNFAGIWLLLSPMPMRAVGLGVLVVAVGLIVSTVTLFALRWIVPVPWTWRVAAARVIVAVVTAASLLLGVLAALDVATAGPPPAPANHKQVKH